MGTDGSGPERAVPGSKQKERAWKALRSPGSGTFAGFGVPVAIGVGLLALGVVVMVIANVFHPQFFRRKTETADPGILEGTVQGRASVMAD